MAEEIDAADKVRGTWTPEEDALLVKLVEEQGARNWSAIATGVPGRSGKSCRLRWCNQLSPNVEHRPFTPAEDAVIVRAHALHGNKWSVISKMLPGRTDNAIKNHWNSSLKRRRINDGHYPVSMAVSSASNSAVKRSFLDASSDSTTESSDSGMKRQCSGTLQDRSSCDGPVTLLTLLPPREKAIKSMVEEERRAERKSASDRERSTITEVGETGLVRIMKSLIAEEVRNYFDSLRAKGEYGTQFGQILKKNP